MTTAVSRVSKSHGGRCSVDDQLVLREIAPPDTNLAHAAMRELRTSLSSSEDFVDQVDLIQRPQGYRLVGVFYGEDVDAVSVAGFRQSTNLSWDDTSMWTTCRRLSPNVARGVLVNCWHGSTMKRYGSAAARFTWTPASGRTVARPTGCI